MLKTIWVILIILGIIFFPIFFIMLLAVFIVSKLLIAILTIIFLSGCIYFVFKFFNKKINQTPSNEKLFKEIMDYVNNNGKKKKKDEFVNIGNKDISIFVSKKEKNKYK